MSMFGPPVPHGQVLALCQDADREDGMQFNIMTHDSFTEDDAIGGNVISIGGRCYQQDMLIHRFSRVQRGTVGDVPLDNGGWESEIEIGINTYDNTLPENRQPVSLEVRAEVFGNTPDPAQPFYFLNAYHMSNPVPKKEVNFKLRIQGLDAPRRLYYKSRRQITFERIAQTVVHKFHLLDTTAVVNITFPNGETLTENASRHRRIFELGIVDITTTPVMTVMPTFAPGFSFADLQPGSLEVDE